MCSQALDVHPCDTAQDVLQKLADKIGLQSLDGWALFQTTMCNNKTGSSEEETEDHIPQHCFLYDIISQWELHPATTSSNNSSQSKSKKQKGSNPGGDNRFVMKKRLFCNTREIPSDPIEVSLLYAQAVYSVVKKVN